MRLTIVTKETRALQRKVCRHTTVHRTVGGGNGAIIVSGVPPHVVPPEQISRNRCPRSFMGKGRIERPFPIGDALAMRPLRPMPAGIRLPLAELILGEGDFAPLRWSDQGALPSGPRKPLKRLDLNFFDMTDPTECEKLVRRSARRSNRRVEGCKELYENSYNLPGALAMAVTITTEAVGTPPTNANKAAGAPRLCASVKSPGRVW